MRQPIPLPPHPLAPTGRPGDLGGIIAASLTPVDRLNYIDVPRLGAHIAWLFAEGCSFVSPFGSTGEGPSFSVREKLSALGALAEMGVPMERLIPAAMSPSVEDTAAMIKVAADLGCRAALIVPPFYYGAASQKGVALFLQACASRLGGQFPIDVVLYHIPAMAKIGFGISMIEDLRARFGARIAGIKDSTGDRDHTLALVRAFPTLPIFTGDDRVLPALLAAGGAGMIGGLPNVVAADLCAFYNAPHGPDAARLAAVAALRIAAVDDHGGIPALKALKAEMSGDIAWAQAMPPLEALDEPGYAALRARFDATQFQFAKGSA